MDIQDRACVYCQQRKRIQIYLGEEYCCELCRKILAKEITEEEWKKALPVFPPVPIDPEERAFIEKNRTSLGGSW